MDIEDEKIIKKNKLEEQKKRENTQIVSLENMNLSEIKIFKNQKISKKGEMFKDDLFKPIRENLCEINKKGDWILNEKINKNDILGWEKIKWVRAEIALNTKNFQVFYDGISSNDIQQGKLGDCYFLSSVSALTQFPKLITRLFYFKEKSEQNCYGCFLRINGIWQLILIDDFFPVYPSFNNKSYNIVFSSTNSNEIWVMLLEKAWAKVNGNYARIISGEPTEALDILTDAYSYKINLSNIKNDEEEKNILLNKLKTCKNKGFIMTAGTLDDCVYYNNENVSLEEVGLVPGHAYSLLNIREINTKNEGLINLIYLRNPWGNTEWSRDWSDKSLKWTENLRRQCNVEIKDDGSFYMSYEDFLIFFNVIYICEIYPNYIYFSLQYDKNKVFYGPILSKIEVNDNHCNTYIQLHQRNNRSPLNDGTYQNSVIAYLILIDDKYNYICSNYAEDNFTAVNFILNKGIYYIISDINYRYIKGIIPFGYTIGTYASYQVNIYEEFNYDIYYIFKNMLIDYSKKKIKPQNFNKGILYKSNDDINKDFPFNFFLFDNSKGSFDVTFSDKLKSCFGNNLKCDFYMQGNNVNRNLPLEKKISVGEIDFIAHMPWECNCAFQYSIETISSPYRRKRNNKINENNIINNNNFNNNNFNNNNFNNNNFNNSNFNNNIINNNNLNNNEFNNENYDNENYNNNYDNENYDNDNYNNNNFNNNIINNTNYKPIINNQNLNYENDNYYDNNETNNFEDSNQRKRKYHNQKYQSEIPKSNFISTLSNHVNSQPKNNSISEIYKDNNTINNKRQRRNYQINQNPYNQNITNENLKTEEKIRERRRRERFNNNNNNNYNYNYNNYSNYNYNNNYNYENKKNEDEEELISNRAFSAGRNYIGNNENINNNNIKIPFDEIFSQKPESLDRKGKLNQYVFEGEESYFIGIENLNNNIYSMILKLEGLYEENHPNDNFVSFRIGRNQKKVFHVLQKDDYEGDMAFVFQLA